MRRVSVVHVLLWAARSVFLRQLVVVRAGPGLDDHHVGDTPLFSLENQNKFSGNTILFVKLEQNIESQSRIRVMPHPPPPPIPCGNLGLGLTGWERTPWITSRYWDSVRMLGCMDV